MNSKEVKKFVTETLKLDVSVRTIPCKSKWIDAYIKPEGDNGRFPARLVYKQSYPEDFRKICIKVVYPNSPTLQTQSAAGNIGIYGITMYPHEWELAIQNYRLKLSEDVMARIRAND